MGAFWQGLAFRTEQGNRSSLSELNKEKFLGEFCR